MNEADNIFSKIKREVQAVVPAAKVYLFGSRATNTATIESDWDILILTQTVADKKIKDAIHEKVFPISVQIRAFINLIVIQEKEWNNNPAYYSLHQTIETAGVTV